MNVKDILEQAAKLRLAAVDLKASLEAQVEDSERAHDDWEANEDEDQGVEPDQLDFDNEIGWLDNLIDSLNTAEADCPE